MLGLMDDYNVIHIKEEAYIVIDEEAVDSRDLIESKS